MHTPPTLSSQSHGFAALRSTDDSNVSPDCAARKEEEKKKSMGICLCLPGREGREETSESGDRMTARRVESERPLWEAAAKDASQPKTQGRGGEGEQEKDKCREETEKVLSPVHQELTGIRRLADGYRRPVIVLAVVIVPYSYTAGELPEDGQGKSATT